MGITSQERAAWGVSVPRAFTREEKKHWTKEEKGMYKAFELHGKEQAWKLMRSYFARKKSEGAEEDLEPEEAGVSMTCSLPNLRKCRDTDKDAGDTGESSGAIFGDQEQEDFIHTAAMCAGLDDSAVTITKITDFGNAKDSQRLYVTFEISTAANSEQSSEAKGDKLSADDICTKFNDKDGFLAMLASKNFVGVEIVHIAEVIGGARAAKKARKSIMDQMYGDSNGEGKNKHGESDKAKEAE